MFAYFLPTATDPRYSGRHLTEIMPGDRSRKTRFSKINTKLFLCFKIKSYLYKQHCEFWKCKNFRHLSLAEYLVTGDKKDLLALGTIDGTRIVSARQFVEAMGL